MILTLHLRWQGTKNVTVPVESLAEASQRFCESRDSEYFGSSHMRFNCGLLTDGKRIVGHVSYNGKVWRGRPENWKSSDMPLYVPDGLTAIA